MYKETLGLKLKQAREKWGFTQKEVAKETNIKQTTISKYENGTPKPDIETLAKLIDFYQEDANYIIGTRGRNKIEN